MRDGEHVRAGEGFVAIRDVAPKAPVHLLVLPERHVETFRGVGAQIDLVLAKIGRVEHLA